MSDGSQKSNSLFDPRPFVPIHVLPEGTRRLGAFSRLLRGGDSAYDPLWRYVKRVNPLKYLGQSTKVRFGEHTMGMRGPARISTHVDFLEECIYVGRKLTIPFASLRGLMVGQGLLAGRQVPVFVMFIRVDGCDQYIPIHQCMLDATVVDLADFLAAHLRVPMGIASRPLGLLVNPGSPRLIHSQGETPLYEHRGFIIVRGPTGQTKITMMAGTQRVLILDQPDPLGWLERWGLLVDDIIAQLARRARSRFRKESRD